MKLTQQIKRHDEIVASNSVHNKLQSARWLKVARLLADKVRKELGATDADFTAVAKLEILVKVPYSFRSPACMKGADNYR